MEKKYLSHMVTVSVSFEIGKLHISQTVAGDTEPVYIKNRNSGS